MLPVVSKIFEQMMQIQIASFINEKLYTYMSALILLEKWKKSLDYQGYAGAVIMDLSKAFDSINYELLIGKLHAYGFTKLALKLVHSYPANRCHRTKINTTFSTWNKLLTGVPDGSILGLLLFNIYINDLFFIIEEVEQSNYADDTSLHVCNKDLPNLLNSLEHDTHIIP